MAVPRLRALRRSARNGPDPISWTPRKESHEEENGVDGQATAPRLLGGVQGKAVRLVLAGNKPVTQLARELDVPRQLLHNWVRQSDRKAGRTASDIFPGNGKRPADEAELDRLRRELAQAKEDIEILKKATAFFAKHHR